MNPNKNIAIFKKYFDSEHEALEQANQFIEENFDRIEENDKPLKIYIEIGGL